MTNITDRDNDFDKSAFSDDLGDDTLLHQDPIIN